MRLKFILIISIFCTHFSAAAVNDTSWLNKVWKPCQRDTAIYYSLSQQNTGGWNQRIYYKENQQLFMTGSFEDEARIKKSGVFKWYNRQGMLTDSILYENSIPLLICHFHENGTRKRILLNDKNYHTTEVQSWDSKGIPITADTFYNNRFGRDCHRDTASFKQTINLEDGLWHYRFYSLNGDTLYSDYFLTERMGKKQKKHLRYFKNGMIRDSITFHENGKHNTVTYFYNTGIKNAYQVFDTSGKRLTAKNWDEAGKEIEQDTKFKYAVPVEGFKTWQKKILKQINNDPTIEKKIRRDLYGSVFIGFFIEDDGNVREMFIKESSPYPQMDSIILNACRSSVNWTPCTFHGRRERFFGVHSFSFVKGKVIRYKTLY